MWATKSSWLGGSTLADQHAPIAMCPFDLSLARNDVSNDVNLSIWRWAMSLLLSLARIGSSVQQRRPDCMTV